MKLEATSSFHPSRDSGPVPEAPPTAIPGYEPRRYLGSGAYGEVWVALDKTTGRKVAIKFFARAGEIQGSSLGREVEKLVALSADRYVVQLLDIGWEADPPYYVMEYIENGSLDDRLRNQGTLSVGESIEIFRDVAVGLSHAHSKGIIHCDIKPANVLLDQDDKPRLADFGQARLMCEQDPTLGTLYFMAPEQADTTAMPDARWDVYALGALLYSMLTGTAPHRTDERMEELQSADKIEERLRRYREQLSGLPTPKLHREVPGVDRALAEIVERCLAANPEERFHSVDAVLEALHDRARARVRRPLLLLGLVGPLLLMLTTGFFGYRAYLRAMKEAAELAKQGSTESNLWAADSTAKLVANELDKRFAALQSVASDRQLLDLLQRALADKQLAPTIDQLSEPPKQLAEMQALRQAVLDSQSRQGLQAYLTRVLKNERFPYAASWFVTSNRGTMLAAAFHVAPEPEDFPVGKNYSYRTYFHGGPRDLPEDERTQTPISGSHLSALFQSTATQTWKVAMSQPLVAGDEILGILAMTVELGDFVRFRSSPDRCALLVDARDGDHRGVVLQHPLFSELLERQNRLPERFAKKRVDIDQLIASNPVEYTDPLATDELGQDYAGQWLACTVPVKIERLVRSGPEGNGVTSNQRETGLMLIVQQRLKNAVAPVENLGPRLLREGLAALAIVIAVISVLWWAVVQMLRERGGSGSKLETSSTDHSMHSRDTLPSPGPK